MMLKRKLLLFFILPLLAGVMFAVFGAAPRASALTLNPANFTYDIIDDSAFEDTTTMTPASIQAFLNSEGSGLANFRDVENCGSSSGAHYTFYTQHYSCGTTQVAAQIIYDASQAYGINPRVILATLQKEQSLVTTPNPTASQLNFAMGYGCPDSGGCSFPGFFNQVDNGTWQFKTDMELGSGNNWWGYTPASYPCNGGTNYYSTALKAGNTVTFYDDNGTPYNTITLSDMSTASLYCYTPHVYNNPNGQFGLPQYGSTGDYYTGSYNFAYYFTAWFGSPTGELLRTPDSGQIYIVNTTTGMKYPINSLGVLGDFSALGIRYVADTYLNQFTTGQAVGNMVQGPDGTLYLVSASIKLPFTSCSGDVVTYGFTCSSSSFVPLMAGQVNKLASGPGLTNLVKSSSNNTVYYVTAGTRRPITSWSDLLSFHQGINVLSDNFVNQLPTANIIYGLGSLVKSASSGTVYMVKDLSSLFSISSFVYPQELGQGTSVTTLGSSDFADYTGTTPSSITTQLSCVVGGVTTDYVGTGTVMYKVGADLAAAPGYSTGTPSNYPAAGGLCTNLNLSSQTLNKYVLNNSTIYYINSSGQKQAFSSYASYLTSQNRDGNPGYILVSDYFLSTIPVDTASPTL